MTINQVRGLLLVGAAVCSWILWAQHPTARSLRRALIDTAGL